MVKRSDSGRGRGWRRSGSLILTLGGVLLAGACTSLPTDYPKTVSTALQSPVTTLYERVEANGSELLVFDINRSGWLKSLVNLEFEKALMPAFRSKSLAYKLTLLSNVSADSPKVAARTRDGARLHENHLGLTWPETVFSLSHSAVPFPADDPIYGVRDPDGKGETRLPLGSLDFKGESGVLMISDGQILRLRHNPFFPYMETHMLEWMEEVLQ